MFARALLSSVAIAVLVSAGSAVQAAAAVNGVAGAASSVQAEPIVAYSPALSRDRVAFAMGGEVWLTDRTGGSAVRLTTGAGVTPTGGVAFSPDGTQIAYSAAYGGDADVYVMPVEGGAARRLTFAGQAEEVVGWSADGRTIRFRSTRDTFYPMYGLPRVFAVPVEGGPSAALDYPVAYNVAYSEDGLRVAVEPQQLINISWKQYRGGDQRRILLVDPQTMAQRDLPGPLGNDHDPMWIDGALYFLSDRDGRTGLYRYDPATEAIVRVFDPGTLDIKSASAGPGGIIFAQLNGISVFDPTTGTAARLSIRPVGDDPGARPTTVDLSKSVIDADVSDVGEVAIEARGRTLLIDAAGQLRVHGDSDHVERAPAFIREGQVSVFSDAVGHNQLVRIGGEGEDVATLLPFETSAYYQAPVWSSDGRRVVYLDLMANVWVAEPGQEPRQIDREARATPRMAWSRWGAVWSKDGDRLAYSRSLSSGLSAVFVWSAHDGRSVQVSPSEVDARDPAWDADGERLWFSASNNTPPGHGYLDQTGQVRKPATRKVFSVRPQGQGWSRPRASAAPARRYEGVYAGEAPGSLYLLETRNPAGMQVFSMTSTQALLSIDADSEEAAPVELITDIGGFYPGDLFERFTTSFRMSRNRSKALYRTGDDWKVADLSEGAVARTRTLALNQAVAVVEPRREWRQMAGDAIRQVEYLLHDPTHPTPNYAAWRALYLPLSERVRSRADLTYLLEDMMGELHLSHADVAPSFTDTGGDRRPAPGSLAADVEIEHGRYRLKRIYSAPMFGDGPAAPLDDLDLGAGVGDVIVSIAGQPVTAERDLAEYLQGAAGKPTQLCLSASGRKGDERCARIKPVENDAPLRFAAWLDERQAIVDRLGGGRVGYLHSSDTMESGMAEFNAARYAQHEREGFVVDVRYNGGGMAADYLIQTLTAPELSRWIMPQGRSSTTPAPHLGGPKVLITNAYCGSGCDTYAYYFKAQNVGPIVGTPTWGGVSGGGGAPTLLDGGLINVPQYTMTDVQGAYALEGQAVQPTLPIDLTLRDMAQGRDVQLEAAVAEVMRRLIEGDSAKSGLTSAP